MRKHRVDERAALATGAIAGLVAATSGASPTGSTLIDALLIIAAVGLVTWASATAPWWAVAAIAGVSAAVAGSVPWFVVGFVAFAFGLWIGIERRDLPVARAAVTGTALNVLIRSDLHRMLGLSAVVGIGCALAVLALGLRRRSRRTRHGVLLGLGVAGVVALFGTIGFAAAAGLGAGDLRDGSRAARAGIRLLDDGDYRQAALEFEQAADRFDGASDALTQPWSKPARLVPIVAQNRTATVELVTTAATASRALSEALTLIDPEQLRLVNGRIDIASIELIEQPFLDVQAAIDDLDATLDDVASPWLVAPLQNRLMDLDGEVADAKPKVDNAVTAVQLAPAMLGADGERRYFIAFTTPAETRGLGGFMGNWAELTANDGRLAIADFGRTLDLNRGRHERHAAPDARSTDPQEWLDQWGDYGFTSGPNGGTEAEPWSNVTISPQFPSTGDVIAQLFPQSGGDDVDGVFAMDPYVLQALLGLTGPITVDNPGSGPDGSTATQLDQSNVIDFLLVDQYEIDDSENRVDLLAAASRATVEQVLGGALPSPAALANVLSPLAAQGRLAGWSRNDTEQALFDAIHLSGALPDLAGGDGIAVVLNNAGANKLDVYLERSLDYDATVDVDTGEVMATATVTLTNNAPSSGLPGGVIGNYTGEDPGTNRTLLSLYSALPVESATVARLARMTESDGGPFEVEPGTEAGWFISSTFLAIPPGESVTVTYRLSGILPLPDGYTLAVRPQPIVANEMQHLRVVSTDGATLVEESGPATEPRVVR